MRTRTRNLILAILGIVALLLALGALPGLLRSDDPYYVTATAADDGALPDDRIAVNSTTLPEGRYPYTTAALDGASPEIPGQSEPYWRGPVGVKETFTHSPFDELSALRQRNATAAIDDGVYVRDSERLYRLAVTRGDDG
jgi:hypothetical protein